MNSAWCNPSLSLPERVRAWVEYNEPEARWDAVYQAILDALSDGPMIEYHRRVYAAVTSEEGS